MVLNQTRPEGEDGTADRREDRGALVAMQHVGEWVRFADTKAGLVAAAAAAVLALAGSRASNIATAISNGGGWAILTSAAAIFTAVLAIATFWCVIHALVPRPINDETADNRFAWPVLAKMTEDALREHLVEADAESDAWAQARTLAKIAVHKYAWCRGALVGLVLLIASSIVTVGVAAAALT